MRDKNTSARVCAKNAGGLMHYGICDPLSENPAHPAFHENHDKTGNRYIDV